MLADSIHISLEGGSVSVNWLYVGIVAVVIVVGTLLILRRKPK